ncbi:MAG: hypothetical protein INR71_12885, partial [Terriglobus roseus]|nr:hypothetical protein [Terriglobus roseus]
IRVKVHADDTRYVMVAPGVTFRDFADQIRAKFGLRTGFKIKMRDEDDFVTMSDQDDLDMAVQAARELAKRERAEMGKMEVSLPLSFVGFAGIVFGADECAGVVAGGAVMGMWGRRDEGYDRLCVDGTMC